MSKLLLPCLLVVFVPNVFSATQYDYYWREYSGAIPTDAIVGGKDINGNNVYIGQAYIKDEGLMVVQINPGKTEVKAAIKGVKTVNTHIKILCGPKQNFVWLPAKAADLHITLLNKHAVIGGHEDGKGQMNIGRISIDGETKIGKVNAFLIGDANFRFVDKNDNEPLIKTYEVLVYSPGISEDVLSTIFGT